MNICYDLNGARITLSTSIPSLRLPFYPLIVLNKNLPEPEVHQIRRDFPRTLRILSDQLPRRLLEQLINFF